MDDLINKAFEQANRIAEEIGPITQKCQEHIQRMTPNLIDIWTESVGLKKMLKVTALMSDRELQDAISNLVQCFFVGGYNAALGDVKNKEI